MQRQLRLGDILDDYCPRERRVTNHAVVAMVGDAVKQTRCSTCDTEHEYKQAKVPRQRRKPETPAALYSQVVANAPKRVAHDTSAPNGSSGQALAADARATAAQVDEVPVPGSEEPPIHEVAAPDVAEPLVANEDDAGDDDKNGNRDDDQEEGPVHRPLIRASLPRHEGQPPPTRPIPEFTIRQPAGRQNRFRPRQQRPGQGGGQQFQGNRSNGGGNSNFSGGPPRGMRSGGGRPPQGAMSARPPRRDNPGRRRPK